MGLFEGHRNNLINHISPMGLFEEKVVRPELRCSSRDGRASRDAVFVRTCVQPPGTMFQRRGSNPGTMFQVRRSSLGTMFQRRCSSPGTTFQERCSSREAGVCLGTTFAQGRCSSRDDVRPGTMLMLMRTSKDICTPRHNVWTSCRTTSRDNVRPHRAHRDEETMLPVRPGNESLS